MSSRHEVSPIVTVDVAHPPLPGEEVERILLEETSGIRNSKAKRILKVIHGYGSHGRGGTSKEVVRNWAFGQRSRLRQVIEGESYDLYNRDVQAMRGEIGAFSDPDLQTANPGITILWVK